MLAGKTVAGLEITKQFCNGFHFAGEARGIVFTSKLRRIDIVA
jgi:hypothetical protein